MSAAGSETQLVGLIRRVLNLREERAGIGADIRAVLAEAKATGFDPARISEVCRRVELIEKHGRDKVEEAEALRALYVETFEGAKAGEAIRAATGDAKLAELLAAPPPQKPRKITATVARLRADAEEARKALGDT